MAATNPESPTTVESVPAVGREPTGPNAVAATVGGSPEAAPGPERQLRRRTVQAGSPDEGITGRPGPSGPEGRFPDGTVVSGDQAPGWGRASGRRDRQAPQ